MKRIIFSVFFSVFLLTSVFQAQAQSGATSAFDMTEFPQWAKDMRRFDVITFGSFPFSWFFINFFYDLYNWNKVNGMDFSSEGRQYAPWPLKSAGAKDMNSKEYVRTFIAAASLSAVVAVTDLVIVNIKRNKQRRRIESRSAGSVIINKTPYGEPEEDLASEDAVDDPDDTE